jgi:hypothetical protein
MLYQTYGSQLPSVAAPPLPTPQPFALTLYKPESEDPADRAAYLKALQAFALTGNCCGGAPAAANVGIPDSNSSS